MHWLTKYDIVPYRMLSSGFPESSFREGLKFDPDFIGVDCGSTDSGPFYLGSGTPIGSRSTMAKYVTTLLRASKKRGIPLIIGSAVTAGGEPHLQWPVSIVKEVMSEEGMHVSLGVVHAEQDKEYLVRKLTEGKIEQLNPWRFKVGYEISEERIRKSERIVGVMDAVQITSSPPGIP